MCVYVPCVATGDHLSPFLASFPEREEKNVSFCREKWLRIMNEAGI